MEDFGAHFGGHLESKICESWRRFGMWFRDVFVSDRRVVLGMFWESFWCQNDDQKAKGGFVEMLVLLM